MNNISYDDLELLFIASPDDAISECEEIICQASNFNSFDEFFSYHFHQSHSSTCQKEWRENKIAVNCFDCALNTNACICLECFLNGNHQGHRYSILADATGYCDCGNSSLWKPSGFCKNHQGHHINNPEDYLDKNLRTILTDIIFKAAFSAANKIANEEDERINSIFQFIFSFLKLGDGFRRLISISLTEKNDFNSMVTNFHDHSVDFTSLFIDLAGFLINDQIFNQNFSNIIFNFIIDFMKSQSDSEVYNILDSSIFYAFSPRSVQYNVIQKKFDWIGLLIQFFDQAKTKFNHIGDTTFNSRYPSFCEDFITNMRIASSLQPNDETQLFFDRLFTEIVNCGTKESSTNNTIIATSFRDFKQPRYFDSVFRYVKLFEYIFSYFKFKKNLKIDKLIEELDKGTDLSSIYSLNNNPNDKYIFKYIQKDFNFENCLSYPSYYYSSFHNGSSFFLSMPLYDSFVTIAGLDNIFRVNIARILLNEKYQSLRIKLGIITVKQILSFYCSNQSIIPKKNHAINDEFYLLTNDPRKATHSISRYLPVFQLLIGLDCNSENDEFSLKDYFTFEIAREIGIFDDFSSEDYEGEDINENQFKMNFSFFHLCILTVIDRILFNFDSNKYINEQLVSAFKNGISDLNDLELSYDKYALEEYQNPANFDEVLLNISTIRKNENKSDLNNHEVSFHLKENVKYNPISGINPINHQKSILHKEITKNPDKLISIPEFDDEEVYFFNMPSFSKSSLTIQTDKRDDFESENEIPKHDDLKIHLKEFLMTPTVLAIVYHSLASSQKNEMNDHLALNILILITNFLRKDINNDKSDKLFNDLSIEYNSITDLISKFKNVVFNYQEDKACIQNTINNVGTFMSFLNMKISFQKNEKKSFIDLILSKGKIGKQALEMMSIKHDENKSDENDEKMMKKKRANKIKEEIISKYKDMISNYNADDTNEVSDALNATTSNSVDIDNKSDEVCSVCLTAKKNEVLSYPIFIYRTKFPFIFDKPSNDSEDGLSSKSSPIGCDFVIQYSLCNHPVHQSCIGPISAMSLFRCPIDRTNKNGILPSLESVSIDSPSDEVIQSIEMFLMNFQQVLSNGAADVFVELIKSLSGLITTYEVRLRSLPGCLDSINTKILSRNLFLTAWMAYRIRGMPQMVVKKPIDDDDDDEIDVNVDEKLTLFQQFVKKLIECQKIDTSSFHFIVESFLAKINKDSERKEKELLLFLRRVCLANYFLLNNDEAIKNSNDSEIIDWDDILSIENLSKQFKVEFHFLNELFEFKPFVGLKLPKDFLHLALEPYKLPVEETSKVHLLNLIDYDYLIENYDDFGEKEMSEKYEVVSNPAMSYCFPSVYMFVGRYASKIFVNYGRCIIQMRPFYLDMFGSPDIEFERHRPLMLNEERYERFIDEILSGNFSKLPISF